MSERETKSITTPISKVEVKFKAWLTARERRNIRAVYLSQVKVGTSEDGEPDTKYEVSADLLERAQDVAIENIVLSVDGKSENILDTILEMQTDDFDAILKEVNIISGNDGLSSDDKKK